MSEFPPSGRFLAQIEAAATSNTGIAMNDSLQSLLQLGESNPAVHLLAVTALQSRASADFARPPTDPFGGVFLADETPATLKTDGLAGALARIGQAEAASQAAAGLAREGRRYADELLELPAPARDAALKSLRKRSWSFGGIGIRRLPLAASQGAITELVRVEPGFGAAEHDHTGDELTLVLTGAYGDGHGAYQPGEISHAGAGFVHTPRAEFGGVCYLMLSTFGEAKFTGRIGVLQRFTGFPWQPRIDEHE
jgi:putative transcriptional regulator